MAVISDILLVAGALGAAFYCMVLSRRLRRFTDLEKGVGGAIAVLSAQVDDMTRALDGARVSAKSSSSTLVSLTDRAEGVAQRLELLVASLHDLPIADNAPAARAASMGNEIGQSKTALQKAATDQEANPTVKTETDPPEPLIRTKISFIRSGHGSDDDDRLPPLVLRGSREVTS